MLKFELARSVLTELKKEFGREDNELAKIAKLKKTEQGPQTIDKSVQIFRYAVKNSRYKSWVLVEKFKRKINSTIKQNLIKTK